MADGTQSGFDVDAARKAGYSDDEILQHLTSTRNFDVAGATKAGYSTQEIIQHLSTTAPPSKQAAQSQGIPKNYGFTAANMESQGYQGLKQLGSSLYEMGHDLLFPEGDTIADKQNFLANKYIKDPAMREKALAQNAPDAWTSIGHSVAEALPLIGPWAAGLGEQAGTGDIGGALARGGVQVAAGELARPALGAAGKVRENIGAQLHTPAGELTPKATLASQLAGGAVGTVIGTEVGHPYAGGALGYKAGPAITESLFPEPKNLVEAREQAARYQSLAEDVMNRGREQERLDRQAQLVAQRQARAELLAKRGTVVGKQPIGPQAPEATPPPAFPGATPSNVPVGNAPLPAVQNPLGGPTPFGQPQLVSKFQSAQPGKIVSPETPAPPINKTYVSYSAADLVELARKGDLNAVRELIRNPRGIKLSDIPNVGYLMEPGRPGRVYGGPTGQ